MVGPGVWVGVRVGVLVTVGVFVGVLVGVPGVGVGPVCTKNSIQNWRKVPVSAAAASLTFKLHVPAVLVPSYAVIRLAFGVAPPIKRVPAG